MTKTHKVIYILVGFASLLLMMHTAKVYAVNTNFAQQILPLDCIFTIENTGTGEIKYITPQACGQAIPTPTSKENSHGLAGSSSSTKDLIGPTISPNQVIVTSPSGSTSNASNSSNSYIYGLPHWSPIATVASAPNSTSQNKQASQPSQSSGTIAVVAVGSSVFLLFMFAFFFI